MGAFQIENQKILFVLVNEYYFDIKVFKTFEILGMQEQNGTKFIAHLLIHVHSQFSFGNLRLTM